MKKDQIENPKGAAVAEREPLDTPLAQYLADNPHAREAHELRMAEFRSSFSDLVKGLRPMFAGIIDKAELVRRLGIVLTEESSALPGGKFTRDFYEQMKHELTDANGQSVPFDLCEWAIRVARENRDPIDDLLTALKYKQPLLLATGDAEFAMEAERPPQHSQPAPDPRADLNRLFDVASTRLAIEKFKARYFRDGCLDDATRDVVVDQWRPFIEQVTAFAREIGL